MRAGKRIHKVVFQSKGQIKDEWDGLIDDWIDHAKAWAEMRFVSGKELVTSDAETVHAIAIFKTKYIPTVTESMRLVWRGRVFDIILIAPIAGRLVDMEVTAKTGANQG